MRNIYPTIQLESIWSLGWEVLRKDTTWIETERETNKSKEKEKRERKDWMRGRMH